jgi:hypothetical protein
MLTHVAVLLAAALAARGWPSGASGRPVAAWALLGASAAGAALLLAHEGIWHPRPWVALAAASALVAAGRAAASAALRTAASALVPILLFAELGPLYRGYHPQVPRDWAEPEAARAALPAALRSEPSLRMASQWTAPNLPSLLGIVDPRAYSYPVPERYQVYASDVMGLRDPSMIEPDELARPEVLSALERGCADWLMSTLAPDAEAAKRLAPLARRGALRFDRLSRAPPFAAWHADSEVAIVSGVEAAAREVRAGLSESAERVVVEDTAPAAPSAEARPGAAARFHRTAAERIEVEVPPAVRGAPGYLVLRSSYDRGWHAVSGSGVALRVLPAQVRFLAVEVPAGTEWVSLRYWPPGMSMALAASAAGWTALAALAAWTVGARRR